MYCRSIHFSQKYLICFEFGIPQVSRAGICRGLTNTLHVFKEYLGQAFEQLRYVIQ